MEKEIILLTKSKKKNNYCIAGIDNSSGKWIRIISDDESIQNAVKPKYTRYENEDEAEVLDIVQIKCIEEATNYYQPENYIFDKKTKWKKIGQASSKKVKEIHKKNDDRYIFYNNGRKISKMEIKNIDKEDRYSLALVEPSEAKVVVKHWDERTTYTACFLYNNEKYDYISITDESFTNKYALKPDGTYPISDVYFIMSLADIYNGDHYKLIASVISK